MHYPNYNRTLHDIYLYDVTNTGYPIGINPNSLIAGASADFAAVQIRSRQFNVEIIPPPPGATVGVYPNYYNANSPICTIISNKIIQLNAHYTANKPSDFGPYGAIGNPGFYSKYVGLTTSYPYLSLDFWKPDMSGITSYGPFSGFYNFLPSSLLPSGYSFGNYFYFTGSPEIPGFQNGETYYQILNSDISFANLLNESQNIAIEPIKIISPYNLLTDDQKENIYSYLVTLFDSTGTSYLGYSYVIPVTNVYFWDGNDKCIPVEKIGLSFKFRNSTGSPAPNNNIPVVDAVEAFFDTESDGSTSQAAVGDSSGQLIYLHNNKLYFIGSAVSTSTSRSYVRTKHTDSVEPKLTVAFSLYQNSIYANLQGLDNLPLDRNHYSTCLTQGNTLATKIDFTRSQEKLNSIINKLNILLTNISN